MAQIFYMRRLVFALVLSAVVVLNAAQLTQAKTVHTQQSYPTQAQAEEAISSYYAQLNDGLSTLQHFDSITYKPI